MEALDTNKMAAKILNAGWMGDDDEVEALTRRVE
jgi:hypothetical protein